jgi:hypothetical protein
MYVYNKIKKLRRIYFVALISLFLLIPVIFFKPLTAMAQDPIIHKLLVSINKKNQTIAQAIGAVAEMTNMTIEIKGKKPSVKKDIFLPDTPLGEAIIQILRLYEIQNHAVIYDFNNKSIILSILESSTTTDTLLIGESGTKLENYQPLTPEQISQLEQVNTIGDHEPLTPEQISQLEPENTIGDHEPLTREQISQLETPVANSL